MFTVDLGKSRLGFRLRFNSQKKSSNDSIVDFLEESRMMSNMKTRLIKRIENKSREM